LFTRGAIDLSDGFFSNVFDFEKASKEGNYYGLRLMFKYILENFLSEFF